VIVNTNINKTNNLLSSQLSEHKKKFTTYIVMSLMNLKDLNHVSPMILMLFVNDLPEALIIIPVCILYYIVRIFNIDKLYILVGNIFLHYYNSLTMYMYVLF